MSITMKNGREFTFMVAGYKGEDGGEPLRCVACDQEFEEGQKLSLGVSEITDDNYLMLDPVHTICPATIEGLRDR